MGVDREKLWGIVGVPSKRMEELAFKAKRTFDNGNPCRIAPMELSALIQFAQEGARSRPIITALQHDLAAARERNEALEKAIKLAAACSCAGPDWCKHASGLDDALMCSSCIARTALAQDGETEKEGKG